MERPTCRPPASLTTTTQGQTARHSLYLDGRAYCRRPAADLPRSFLTAIRRACDDSREKYRNDDHAQNTASCPSGPCGRQGHTTGRRSRGALRIRRKTSARAAFSFLQETHSTAWNRPGKKQRKRPPAGKKRGPCVFFTKSVRSMTFIPYYGINKKQNRQPDCRSAPVLPGNRYTLSGLP